MKMDDPALCRSDVDSNFEMNTNLSWDTQRPFNQKKLDLPQLIEMCN